MSESDDPSAPPIPAPPPPPAPPEPVTRRWRGPSLVWVVPIVAVVVGISLLVRSILATGPVVTIDFPSADGLKAGQTEVRFKEVVVGRVESVSLSDDRSGVAATVRLARSASSLAVEDTRFWVVKPRIGIGGVSGLETLLSGAYIGVDAGESTESETHFKGLPQPPYVLRGEPGRGFTLRTGDLGSLDVGSPIYYRRTQVGRVVGFRLDPKADEILVQVFVQAPYDTLVTPYTRFWNASGVDLTVNASGLTLNTQTLASVLAGGLAFERPPESQTTTPAEDGHRFVLFPDRKAALAPPDGAPLRVRMVFEQSVRGLSVGAPIDFLGIEIGNVKAINLDFDRSNRRFPIEVTADLYPLRLGAARESLTSPGTDPAVRDVRLLERLVRHGVRAQARSGNLLTGQMYIALDFFKREKGVVVDTESGVPSIPTVPGTLSELQPQIAEIVDKLNKVPFDDIGRNLNTTLAEAHQAISKLSPEAQAALADVRKTLGEVNKTLGTAQQTIQSVDRNLLSPEAPIQRNAEQTLLDLQRAAQSLRTLTDYLERHPESLLRGKPDDAKIGPSR